MQITSKEYRIIKRNLLERNKKIWLQQYKVAVERSHEEKEKKKRERDETRKNKSMIMKRKKREELKEEVKKQKALGNFYMVM